MNPATTNTLLHRYDLGTEVLSVTQANRSRHTAWKLTTNRGTYVVKILASKDLDWIAHYEITEGIATRLADLGINAVAALRSADRVVTEIAGSLFAVYPWIEGDIDPPDTHRSVKIARILAAIHNANLADDARPPKYPSNFDLDLLETLSDEDLRTLALETNRHLVRLRATDEPTLLSHTDLHPENVIWKDGQPYLIDWEEACMAFYSFDVIGPAMNWSGLHADTFAPDQYTAFLLAYKNAYHGPLTCNPELGFWTAMGWGFAWLTHNLRRLNKPNLPPDDIAKHQNASDKVIRVLKSSSIHRNHLTQIQ